MACFQNEALLRSVRPAFHGVGLAMRWARPLRDRFIPVAIALTATIFLLDLALPLGVAAGVAYVVPVVMGWSFEKTRGVFVLAAVSTVLIVIGYFLSSDGGTAWTAVANRVLALFAVWSTATIVAKAKDAGMALRDSEDRFKAMVNNLPAKLHIKDLEGRILLINKEAEKLFGVTDDAARGKTAHEIFSRKRADAVKAHDQAVLETGHAIAEEEEWQREDGSRTFLTVKFPFRDGAGRTTAIGAIGTDITDRKQAERLSERLGRILDSSVNEIYVFDAQTYRFTQVNQGARNNLGYTMQELSGMTPWDLKPAFEEDGFCAMVEPLSSGEKEMLIFETEHRRKNGSLYPVEVRLQLSRTETPPAFVAIIIDITERKQFEEALRDSMTKISAVVNTVVDGIITIDEHGKIETFNAAAERTFGYRADEVIGRNVKILMPEPFQGKHDAYIDTYLESGHARIIGTGREVEGLRKDGSRFPMELAVSEMSVGGRRMFTGIVRDITERKWAEEAVHAAKEAAEIANRAKSEFLATMSHELRTPLNAIIGFSEIMVSDVLGPVGDMKYREYASDIHESGQHLLELINDILDLSKVESGMEELHEEDVNVIEVSDSVLRLVGQRADKHQVRLNLEISSTPPGLWADKRKLKQILVNLLSNAIKFTEPGGKVTLKIWHHSDSGYVFQIIDTGIGMALEDIPKAVSKFGQVDSDLNRKFQGTGLGLPLTKALVDLHGGCFDMQSQVGVGTTVTIRFPAARIMQPRQQASVLGLDDRQAG